MLPVQHPAYGPGKGADDGPDIWAIASHMGDSDGVLGSWLQHIPALAVAAICGMNW